MITTGTLGNKHKSHNSTVLLHNVGSTLFDELLKDADQT